MDTLVDELIDRVGAVVCTKPNTHIISPCYARPISSMDNINISYLAKATRGTVNFADTAWAEGVISDKTFWLEIGHHSTLCGFISRTLHTSRGVYLSLHRGQDNWKTMAKAVCTLYNAGVEIDGGADHRPFEQSIRLIDLPTYAWDKKNYWIQYRGDWNLTKGSRKTDSKPAMTSGDFSTSSIHRIIADDYDGTLVTVAAESSITDPALQDVVEGHAMNGHGVASSVS
jgi:acyl transferase domain-containing protein